MNENKFSKKKSEKSKLSKYFLDMPYLELFGNREIRVEGCKGVLSYEEGLIRINTSGIIICFKGRALSLKSLSPTCLVIEGYVTAIEFDG